MLDLNKVCPIHSTGVYKGLDSGGYAIYQCWCGRIMNNDPKSIELMQYMKLNKKVGWRAAAEAFPNAIG